jgi:hypothetical protein
MEREKGIQRNCITEGCKNKARKGRNYCGSCNTKTARNKNPIRYLYENLRSNARRRGKEFKITIDEFREFCNETSYDKLKGIQAYSLTIDRERPWEGYTKENIRAISLSLNSSLSVKHFVHPGFEPETEPCPF